MFVSVGAGPIYTRLGDFLVKSTLALANYRSFRDDSSLTCVRAIGFARRNDKVYPDLTFSLPKTLIPSPGRSEGQRIVGLGLMSYAGRYSAADPRQEIYSNYLDSLAAFVESLLERDYSVSSSSATQDTEVIDEFRDSLKARLGDYDATRVVHEPATAVDQILEQIASTDVVVATRFHNLLFAFLLGKPAMAISFHSKSVSLISQFGLSNYCQDIDGLSVERLIAQFEDVELNHEEITTMIQRCVDGFREMLDEQYDSILGARPGCLFASHELHPRPRAARAAGCRRCGKRRDSLSRCRSGFGPRLPEWLADLSPIRPWLGRDDSPTLPR